MSNNNLDADAVIATAIASDPRSSFMLYAGAGSGKTSSLVQALSAAKTDLGPRFSSRGARIATITYTKAAAKEIHRRLGFDNLVDVSTIHSFAWGMIRSFPKDISDWLEIRIAEQQIDLREKESNGRPGKASEARKTKLARNTVRLANLGEGTRFTYSPERSKLGVDDLSHAEVIAAFAYLLDTKPLFAELLIGKYPVLLIDEVQDTNKAVMNALLAVQASNQTRFALGLFGDLMQRVYLDGKSDLEDSLGEGWVRPSKTTNFRSTTRIVALNNAVRAPVDKYVQTPRDGAPQGTVRLFVVQESVIDRQAIESEVRGRMSAIANDLNWENPELVKTLILEHSMAAARLGFAGFFDAFSDDMDVRSSVTSRDAADSGNVHFLGAQVAMLANSILENNGFESDQVLRKHSPLINSAELTAVDGRATLRSAVKTFANLFVSAQAPTLKEVLITIRVTNLLELPAFFTDLLDTEDRSDSSSSDAKLSEGLDFEDAEVSAWRRALEVPFAEFSLFYKYIMGRSQFDTQQGVKGLEFPRVMVVLDDSSAAGFLFSFGKLFETTPLSKTDLTHRSEGTEGTIDRTRRLFYVACSRATQSLAVIAYSDNPSLAATNANRLGWFNKDEIIAI
jgi:DNA helicase-2/ATP-dependent DNA helicase PcrA